MAEEKLLLSSGGLISRRIRRWFPQALTDDVLEDIYQEGFIGILQAIQEWDPTKGANFATVAVFKIDGRLSGYRIRQLDMIRIGGHLYESGQFRWQTCE